MRPGVGALRAGVGRARRPPLPGRRLETRPPLRLRSEANAVRTAPRLRRPGSGRRPRRSGAARNARRTAGVTRGASRPGRSGQRSSRARSGCSKGGKAVLSPEQAQRSPVAVGCSSRAPASAGSLLAHRQNAPARRKPGSRSPDRHPEPVLRSLQVSGQKGGQAPARAPPSVAVPFLLHYRLDPRVAPVGRTAIMNAVARLRHAEREKLASEQLAEIASIRFSSECSVRFGRGQAATESPTS